MTADLRYYLSRQTSQAIRDYDMLADGDRVLVAVSGGKDSLTLLNILQYRQTFIPVRVDLVAVCVDAGQPGFPLNEIEAHFKEIGIPYYIEPVDLLAGRSWEQIDCFECARARRKALFCLADRLGFNKIALGHHRDDIAETILMNMFYRGELGAMCPKQVLFDGKLTIIRPLAYVREADIRRYVEEGRVPRLDRALCPHDPSTTRRRIKDLLNQMEAHNPHVKKNIIRSLQNIQTEYLP